MVPSTMASTSSWPCFLVSPPLGPRPAQIQKARGPNTKNTGGSKRPYTSRYKYKPNSLNHMLIYHRTRRRASAAEGFRWQAKQQQSVNSRHAWFCFDCSCNFPSTPDSSYRYLMAARKASCSRYFQLMLQPLSSFYYRLRYLRPPLARAMSRPVIEIPSMIHEAIDEETIANYNPNYYFSAHTGQVLER